MLVLCLGCIELNDNSEIKFPITTRSVSLKIGT